MKGRSSSLLATMYCRSSGPMAVSAMRACPRTGNVRRIEHEKRVALARQAKIKASATDLANRLAAVELTIARKVGEQEKLYGSVTSLDIAEALSAQNLPIDRKQIQLEEPIRTLGTFEVPVKLHAEVIQPVKVTVVAEG